jgi:MutS domain V
MVYVILLILAGLAAILYLVWIRKRKAKLLSELRSNWGFPRPSSPETNFKRIGLYDRLKPDQSSRGLDDKTWSDLDLDLVFEYIDRTTSRVGQQFLFHLLRRPRFKEEPLLKFERLINRFNDAGLRERLQVELLRLSHKDALFLPYLFFEELPQFRRYRFLFLTLSISAFASLVGAFFSTSFRFIAVLFAMINIGVSLYCRSRLETFIQPLRLLNVLINTCRRIGLRFADSEISDHLKKLQTEVQKLSGLQRKTALLGMNREYDEVSSLIYEYLSMFFLLEVNCFAFAVEDLRSNRKSVTAIYEELGYLDAAISIASVRSYDTRFTKPVLLEPMKACRFKQIFHPLLESPVPNDLTLNQRSILLTGSNMSGKSTFIRTVGVNAILAQTIHTCFAQEYQAPFLEVKASMGSNDSLMESKSHYLSEVESIRLLVVSAKAGRQCLFLIDELFRGTNTIERVASAKAILEYLNSGDNIVMAATHDIELSELLDHQYKSHHFREIIQNQQMVFDYKIQEGTSSTRNAIAILEMFGYPKPVVARALEVVDQLAEDKSPTTRLFGFKIPRW